MPLSPMMQQYSEIKKNYQDCLLFYRLGDFYELFFEDAHTASRELELTLTGRNCGLEEKAPMCGVPFHAADSYIAKLVEKGYKVAICEQTEDPALAKGIVAREVIRIITPGTLDILSQNSAGDNLYIASIYADKNVAGIAYADVTTGEFNAIEIDLSLDSEGLTRSLSLIAPKELLLPSENDIFNEEESAIDPDIYRNLLDQSYFSAASCERIIKEQFHTESLISLGLDGRTELIKAVGSLLLYLIETQKQSLDQITELNLMDSSEKMHLDRSTIRNLELLETLHDGRLKGSLLGVLDKTKTAMGGRMMKHFIKEPLNDSEEINLRLDAVEALVNRQDAISDIQNYLKSVYDFERLTARIASKRANGRDLIALKTTLSVLPELKEVLGGLDSDLLNYLNSEIDDFTQICDMIETSIVDEPPITISEGNIIKSAYSAELDELKDSIKDAKIWISGLEQRERERTGIRTIKVGFNKVFGYYIDVSRTYSDKVPDEYIRKQTLVNNERYITQDLKEKESLVLSAEAKINALEYEIFKAIRESIVPYISALQKASRAVAHLDVLTSFAYVSIKNGFVRPVVDDSFRIDIREGRHPAVEELIGEGMFIPNDSFIDRDTSSLLIITGPNMSGKSTYMRQTAIIVLMSQIGSFVPCKSAEIGVVDRVFTRIGASDNLSYGQSTFYIEMSELANILRYASERSLIILDEIGRGTSTFDGLSIAWATSEYLSRDELRIRTMFATHYHELTDLSESCENIKNLSVDILESGKDVIFLHKIVEGPASKSYGIHVAKIAGIPREIRKNAELKLKELESGSISMKEKSEQLSFFDPHSIGIRDEDRSSEIIDELLDIDTDKMTPIEALIKLTELKGKVDK